MLKTGTKAPDFSLENKDHQKLSLSQFKGKWVVLYFYPRDNTPGCTQEACEFSVNITDFESLQAVVIGISPDSSESHRKFAEKNDLKVILLSDQDHKVIESYGCWRLKKMYGKESMGVVRSTYLIDPDGKIAALWENVKVKNHAGEVRDKLEELIH